jgi:hypothetical protein
MSSNNRIGYLAKTIAKTDTSSFLIGYLPPNAYITDIKVLITTAYDAGAVLDIGDSATAAKYSNDVDVTSVGVATVSAVTNTWGTVESTSDQTQIKGIVVAGGSTFTAGAGKIIVEYAYVD